MEKVGLEDVAQFIAVQHGDAMKPKEKIIKLLRHSIDRGDPVAVGHLITGRDSSIGVLADLPLPIYITTNYDDLLVRALRARGKSPRRELCRWNKFVEKHPSCFDKRGGFEPTPQTPVVFHLHGHDEIPESLVLTEDDYLDFLVNVSRGELIPPRIQQALTGASLLFVGYRLADMNFRVIFRGLVGSLEGSLRRISVSVQMPPEDLGESGAARRAYLAKYFDAQKVRIYWGSAQAFSSELVERWKASETTT
jgi:hypothetical protein